MQFISKIGATSRVNVAKWRRKTREECNCNSQTYAEQIAFERVEAFSTLHFILIASLDAVPMRV